MPDYHADIEPLRSAIEAHCRRFCDRADAEDLAQESLLKAWRKLGQFQGRSTVRRWVYTVATRVCLDAARGRVDAERAPEVDDDVLCELPGGAVDPELECARREEVACAFASALECLPPRQRAVLILRDVLGWEASECSARLSMTVPAVNSALQRARSTLAARERRSDAVTGAKVSLAALTGWMGAWDRGDADALAAVACAA